MIAARSAFPGPGGLGGAARAWWSGLGAPWGRVPSRRCPKGHPARLTPQAMALVWATLRPDHVGAPAPLTRPGA